MHCVVRQEHCNPSKCPSVKYIGNLELGAVYPPLICLQSSMSTPVPNSMKTELCFYSCKCFLKLLGEDCFVAKLRTQEHENPVLGQSKGLSSPCPRL